MASEVVRAIQCEMVSFFFFSFYLFFFSCNILYLVFFSYFAESITGPNLFLTFLWLFFYFDISDFVRDESFTIR